MEKKKRTAAQKRRLVRDIVTFAALAVFGVIFLLPLLWMIIVTFEGRANISPPVPPKFWIENPSLFNLKLVTENGKIWTAYRNSLIVAACTVCVRLLSASLAGYALSKGNFRGKGLISGILMATMMIPFEVRMIPMFLMFKSMGWYNNFGAVIFPSIVDAFGAFMTKEYFDKIPDSLHEAASLDGLGEFGIFFRIYLPLSGPCAATLAILSFLGSWNDFLWPLIVLNNPAKQTIPLFISSFSMENASRMMGTTMAVSFMAIIPVLIIYLFLQKYIIASVASSGIKE